jgi:hypothetical protein
MRVVASFFFALQIVIAPIAASAAPGCSSPNDCAGGNEIIRSRGGDPCLARQHAGRSARSIGCLFRGRLLAAPLEFPAQRGDRHLHAGERSLGAAARFRGTRHPLSRSSACVLCRALCAGRCRAFVSVNVYAEYFREHAYGLATQSFGPWFREQLINLVVALIATTIALVVLYAVFRRAQRTWWIWGTMAGAIFLLIATMVAPVFVAPLFNTYKPLEDPKISEPILAMARANEIPVQQVYEVDASRQSNRVSANVSGIFGTAAYRA